VAVATLDVPGGEEMTRYTKIKLQQAMVVFTVIAAVVLVIGGLIFLGRELSSNLDYSYHKQHVQSASSWSQGTLDDAKRVVTTIMTLPSNKPGDIQILSYYLRAWNIGPNRDYGFDDHDIIYKGTYMLLTKSDYNAYLKWLKRISRPYVEYKKMLTPPLMPPPWNGLEK
jgi:hypothetical protein